jgi:hypothetical protein
MGVPEKLSNAVLTVDEAEFKRLQQQAQQSRAAFETMFDDVDNAYKEKEQ